MLGVSCNFLEVITASYEQPSGAGTTAVDKHLLNSTGYEGIGTII